MRFSIFNRRTWKDSVKPGRDSRANKLNAHTMVSPLTARQLQRKWRNPPTQPSTSGNKSPSLASSDSEVEIDEVEVQSQPWYGVYSSTSGGYYTTFPPDDDDVGASAPTHYP